MLSLYPYLIPVLLFIACIACSLSPEPASASTNFDSETLYIALVNGENGMMSLKASPLQTSIFSRIDSSYGADLPIPTPNFELLYLILDYLPIPELQRFICLCLQKAFTKSVISFLRYKIPFSYIPIKRVASLELGNNVIASQLINRIYPALHLKGIKRVEEIGTILAITFIYFHVDGVFEITDKTLKLFLNVFGFDRFSCDRANQLLKIKETILIKEFTTSLDIALQLGLITDADLKDETFSKTLSKSQHVYIVQEILKLFKEDPNREKNIEDILLKAVFIDNVTFFRGFLNVFELSEAFFTKMVYFCFEKRTVKIFLELYSNPISLYFLKKNPHLLLLPEHHFETRYDPYEVFRAFISSPSILQNLPQDFIIRAATKTKTNFIFLKLLSSENYQILPDSLSKIVNSLSEIHQYHFTLQSISSFWNSERVYRLFCELPTEERRVIFDKIFIEGKEKSFYHIFALTSSDCKFGYFDDFLNGLNLTEHTAELVLQDSFYEYSYSDNQDFLMKFVTSKSFTLNPEFHPQYLLSALKYKRHKMFRAIVDSESITLSFDSFKDIIRGLSSRETSEDYKYSWAFWMTSKPVMNLFTGFNEESRVDLIKEIINCKHFRQLNSILGHWSDDQFFVVSAQFDLVDYCLRNDVEPSIIKEFVKQKHLYIRFPKSFEKRVYNQIRLSLRKII